MRVSKHVLTHIQILEKGAQSLTPEIDVSMY